MTKTKTKLRHDKDKDKTKTKTKLRQGSHQNACPCLASARRRPSRDIYSTLVQGGEPGKNIFGKPDKNIFARTKIFLQISFQIFLTKIYFAKRKYFFK